MESFSSSERRDANESNHVVFLRYDRNAYGNVVARLRDKSTNSDFLADKPSIELRLENAKKEGVRADVSQLILENWPQDDASR